MNDATLERTLDGIRAGMSEVEVAAMYNAIGKELGAMGPSFDTLICFGANCAEPHHSSDGTVLREGDSIICDVGLMVNRYCSDMTRTVFSARRRTSRSACTRSSSAPMRRAARRCAGRGDEGVRPRRAQGHRDAGYGKYFIHRTGHGIGLEVHEPPDCSATSEVIARPGMVFSIEPGIYLPGRFGVRVEDLVAVTEDGCETLNALTKEMRVLG